ncbi:hypothetical protein D3C73_873410 [compost metagenome]
MRTTTSPGEAMPLDASDRTRMTIARLDEETKARAAEKRSATSQLESSRFRNAASAGDCRIGSVTSPRTWSDRSIRPIPISAVPKPFRAAEPLRNKITPTSSSRGAKTSVPAATSQAVTAVPILAPSSTICAMRGLTRPRSAKEAVISAVAVELCRAIVATRPDRRERRPLLVLLASPVLSRAPKARVTPSFTCARPKRSSATAPRILMTTSVDCTPNSPK